MELPGVDRPRGDGSDERPAQPRSTEPGDGNRSGGARDGGKRDAGAVKGERADDPGTPRGAGADGAKSGGKEQHDRDRSPRH